jgi:hypothetical protein
MARARWLRPLDALVERNSVVEGPLPQRFTFNQEIHTRGRIFARRANPTCQASSLSLVSKHNPSDIGGLVDLGPMSRFKHMNRSIPCLGSHVLGDSDMKIGVGLSPNE